jgi:hypothetical protein
MRYDDMLAIYPNILDLFAGISELIHEDRADSAIAKEWAWAWIKRNLATAHRHHAWGKASKFAAAICGGEGRVTQCSIPLRSTSAPTSR